jgi:hypothetical protein
MTTVQLNDRTPVTGLRLDANGNLVGIARAARTGIQLYAGYEVGKPDMKVVRVYRPEGEVFNRDAMRSFAAAPVTIDHPPVMVDPTNWKDYAKGETASDDIVRDGEIVKVPFLIRDAEAIRTAQDEKHEVSMGYSCKLEFAAGQTPTGEAYDAIQRDIRINHLAIVDKARGGENLRIGDHEPARKEIKVKTILVDGLQVEVTDQAEAAIVKLQGQIADALGKVSDATTKLSDAEKAKSEADGKIVALEKQLSDATNPAALQAAATERADLIARATKIVPGLATDGKTNDEIRKAVVDAKLGASASTLDAAGIGGAFAALAANIKVEAPATRDPVADAITGNRINDGGDDTIVKLADARQKALDARSEYLRTGVYPTEAKSA